MALARSAIRSWFSGTIWRDGLGSGPIRCFVVFSSVVRSETIFGPMPRRPVSVIRAAVPLAVLRVFISPPVCPNKGHLQTLNPSVHRSRETEPCDCTLTLRDSDIRTPLAVPRHIRGLRLAQQLKHLPKLVAHDSTWQVPWANTHAVPPSFASATCVSMRAAPRERIRETGLEAGGAICGKWSCFKASSGDHPRVTTTRNHVVVYGPAVRMQEIFNIFHPKYLQTIASRPQIQAGSQETCHTPNKVVPFEV